MFCEKKRDCPVYLTYNTTIPNLLMSEIEMIENWWSKLDNSDYVIQRTLDSIREIA